MGRESNLFFKSLVERSPDPVVGTDRAGKILFWNSGASQLFGFSWEEVSGCGFWGILKRCAGSSCLAEVEGYMDPETGGWTEEAGGGVYDQKNGFPLSRNVSLFRFSERGKSRYYCVFKTESRDLERRISKLDSELREFAYIISHDLKAPLRAVTILSEWILADYFEKFDNEGKDRIKLLVGRAKKIQAMIDGVLRYSRIGRSGEEPEDVEVNELISELSERVERVKGDRVIVEKKLPVVSFDLMRLRQVFYNLLINAVESNEKKGEIRVDCEKIPGYWMFSVSDNGKGIEKKNLDRIFSIFQTLDANENTDHHGTGLTIVRRIVEVSGGEVWVESVPGKGSTFFFTVSRENVKSLQIPAG